MNEHRYRVLLLTLAVVSAGALLPSGLGATDGNAVTPADFTGNVVRTPPSEQAERASPPTTTVETTTRTVTATTTADAVRRLSFGRASATVLLNCTDFWIEMSPPEMEYSLVLFYLDATTGQRIKFPASAVEGRVEDSFGDTGLLLLEVEIEVPGAPSVAVHTPRRCLADVKRAPTA